MAKRVSHAAMATFLALNGLAIVGTVDDQERLMLDLAAGHRRREDLLAWLRDHVTNLE